MGRLERGAGLVAGLPVGKLNREARLVALGLVHGVRGQVGRGGVKVGAQLVLDVDDGGHEALAHGLDDDVAHLRVAVPLVHELLERTLEGRQVEVPVVAGAQLGLGAGELRDGVDELLGVELVAEVALVGVGLLGLAAAHRAVADDLAAVQERLCLGVVELQRGALLERAHLVQAANPLVGELGVEGLGGREAAAGVDVERDLVGVERGFLVVVVAADVVGDGAVELAGLGELAVALHDGRAVAVSAGDEHHVLLTDAVAQEAGEEVGRHEHAADVAKVQVLVAVGHAGGDDGTLGEAGAVHVQISHVSPSRLVDNFAIVALLCV